VASAVHLACDRLNWKLAKWEVCYFALGNVHTKFGFPALFKVRSPCGTNETDKQTDRRARHVLRPIRTSHNNAV